jgi:hypothetical protein
MHFFFIAAYRGLKSCTSLLENVSLRIPILGTSQRLAFVPQINTVLLGAPMQPTWWGKISTYLRPERFLFIILSRV